jgi:hypothetical protein
LQNFCFAKDLAESPTRRVTPKIYQLKTKKHKIKMTNPEQIKDIIERLGALRRYL